MIEEGLGRRGSPGEYDGLSNVETDVQDQLNEQPANWNWLTLERIQLQ